MDSFIYPLQSKSMVYVSSLLILKLKMRVINQNISKAYDQALKFASMHYENFPVGSLLLPKTLRKHVAIIYWFARTADDIADEGSIAETERLKNLNDFEKSFTELLNNKFHSPFEEALYHTITEKSLTAQLFYDLLKAFKQDVVKKSYKDFDEVLDYCKYSANPIGRLMLELFGLRNEQAFAYSDKVCTALQLTNFYQDIEIDYAKGRIYIAKNEMEMFNVSENHFAESINDSNFARLLEHNLNRTQLMFKEGWKILNYLKGRFRYEIKWTILGGELILSKIRKNGYKIFNLRPSLTKRDFVALFMKSFFL